MILQLLTSTVGVDESGSVWVKALGEESSTWATIEEWEARRCGSWQEVERAKVIREGRVRWEALAR